MAGAEQVLVTAAVAADVPGELRGARFRVKDGTVGFFMFRESFTQFKLGYGAAATLILLVAVLIVSIPAIIQRTAGAR